MPPFLQFAATASRTPDITGKTRTEQVVGNRHAKEPKQVEPGRAFGQSRLDLEDPVSPRFNPEAVAVSGLKRESRCLYFQFSSDLFAFARQPNGGCPRQSA